MISKAPKEDLKSQNSDAQNPAPTEDENWVVFKLMHPETQVRKEIQKARRE